MFQVQQERDELYRKFVKAIHEVQQKSNFKNLLLEKKLNALADTLEKKEAQLNEVLSASNLDPTALTVVTRKLEVQFIILYFHSAYLLPDIYTDRVRSTTEGYVFTGVCLLTGGGG